MTERWGEERNSAAASGGAAPPASPAASAEGSRRDEGHLPAAGPAYGRAVTLEDALKALAAAHQGERPVALAGGTDLLTLMHQGRARPRWLLDIRRIGGLRGMGPLDDGRWRIGALTTLADLARPGALPGPYRALAQAAAASATPALRNRATLGGNLEQQVRCWYFRTGLPCRLAGDDHCTCAAPGASGPFQAVFGHGPGEDGAGCGAVHPSDPAVALVALGAEVELARWQAGGIGRRRVPAGEYFTGRMPAGRPALTVREPEELVVAIDLPATGGGAEWTSAYRKLTDRRAWQFALVSLAASIRWDEGGEPGTAPRVQAARLALGGVALKPWRLENVEAWLEGRRLDPEAARQAGALAVEGARPLPGSEYKVELIRALVADTLLELAEERAGARAVAR
ncbi:molybdopterin dehydrogenase [Thermaerobacter sp. PB12/4term]|uniref:FAD binding domain-containing protein n=1 Tax=Thermaerobacter sp. PB12/4term TaxID=2293838 RepID=UPI000E326F80|nr:FAD binding domain-containing protein [Thermaerobacter sp. PB12/4term]QIA27310.1 molybdopterin dehydrogenase [Thermaerobacter sp. PB12/4term]